MIPIPRNSSCPGGWPTLSQPLTWVPHPSALFAEGWAAMNLNLSRYQTEHDTAVDSLAEMPSSGDRGKRGSPQYRFTANLAVQRLSKSSHREQEFLRQ